MTRIKTAAEMSAQTAMEAAIRRGASFDTAFRLSMARLDLMTAEDKLADAKREHEFVLALLEAEIAEKEKTNA